MRTFLKFSLLMLAVSFLMYSCEKEENKLYYTGGTAPALSTTAATDTVSYVNADKTVLTLSWTNPDYMFTTGISSLDVNYNIEIDTVGSNFTNPAKKVITVSKDLSYSFKSSELNDIMLNQLTLGAGMMHNLEFRVISYLTGNAAKLTSNSIQYSATAYAIPPKVTPPVSGELYITGSATPKGWMNGGDAPVTNQKFTQVSPTLYEITVALVDGSYTFVPIYGDWGTKYSIKTKNDPNEVNGGDFQLGGEDILAPSPGTYKIVVNFQTGKFTVTKQ